MTADLNILLSYSPFQANADIPLKFSTNNKSGGQTTDWNKKNPKTMGRFKSIFNPCYSGKYV